MTRIEQWKNKLEKLSEQREKNVNRYLIPIESKMLELEEKIEKHEESLKNQ